MKQHINAFDYAGHICKALPSGGILLTTKLDDSVNTMTIGWGTIGVEWGRPIFICFVREGRYTRKLLEGNPEFTINVPMGDFDRRILGYCGTKSGLDTDKFADLGLHTEDPEVISVPGIKELPLTLECRVVYAQTQDLDALARPLFDRYYPQNVDSSNPGSNRDAHIAIYGEIVASYIIEK